MRGDSGAQERTSRVPADWLHGDHFKLGNIVELARELTGEPSAAPACREPADLARYWKQKLHNWPGPTSLIPPFPPNEALAGTGKARLSLSSVETCRLRAFSDALAIPDSTLFLATWALLLQRYSGTEDISFGVVKGCMNSEAPDGSFRPHIVPSRFIITPELRAEPWLRAIASDAAAAAPFEFMPLDRIRATAGVPDQIAMFDSVLSVANDFFDPLRFVDQKHPADAVPCSIAATVIPGTETHLQIAFRRERFSNEAAQTILRHWGNLLGRIIEAPNELLSALPLMSPAEREQIVAGFNDTQKAYPEQACIHELFEQQVARTPDAIALSFLGETISYRELNRRANRLARRLQDAGVGPDVPVGICLSRSFAMITSVLAVLKAGGAYVPLDPSYPHERLQFMLEDSRAAVLLTETALQTIFPQPAAQVILLDEPGVLPVDDGNLPSQTTPDHLAYLIYTSGSTGKPKGVAMIHRALVNLIDWQNQESRLADSARTLQFTSLSFDVSFQESLSTLTTGGTLVLITAEMRLSPRDLWRFIVQDRIARIFLPFVALQQLADAAEAEGTTAEALREVITAGEQLQVTPRLRTLFTRHPRATLHNHYGPSETHVVTALTLAGDPEEWPALPPIGHAIQNTQIYILDSNRAPVPIGHPGELYIGGTALARGYFERPEVTAEKFVPDPFSAVPNSRLYRTGDLARFLPDGNIEFLGRLDHQVKIRGYRVELGEIESALTRHRTVREAIVVARETSPANKQLVAYLVPNRTDTIDVPLLREELLQHLPDYMVPSAFVTMERLPLTPSGKVDRKSLPAPESNTHTGRQPKGEAPWLPIQLQLIQLWEEILNVRPIGIRDTFFELGGHSLLAVQMLDQVEQLTGTRLPVTELFHEPTIARLAELLLSEGARAQSLVELQSGGQRPPFYFLHGDNIGGGFYARDLSRCLGSEQPFYVMPPRDLGQGIPPTIEEMAEAHLGDLRAQQPHGPYVIGGFCVGALVAYEIAGRLKAAGESVPLVLLLDPQLASRIMEARYRWLRRRLDQGRDVADVLEDFARSHKIMFRLHEEWNAPMSRKAQFVTGRIRRALGRERDDSADDSPLPAPISSDTEQQILARLNWVTAGYTPPRYDGSVAIFITDEQEELTPFLRARWQKAAPNCTIERVAGPHLDAITKNIQNLASLLQKHLDAAAPESAALEATG